jgi:hypothetical protein
MSEKARFDRRQLPTSGRLDYQPLKQGLELTK